MKLSSAQRLAEKIVAEIAPFCSRTEIAGSIRRGRAEVNDIDLVVIPKNGSRPIVERVTRKWRQISGAKGDARNLRFLSPNEFQLDIFLAHDEIVDLVSTTPTNWGAVLLCRTGSTQHNLGICHRAHEKGLKFAPYRGIIKPPVAENAPERIIASETEEDIYAALGLTWRPPQEREALAI